MAFSSALPFDSLFALLFPGCNFSGGFQQRGGGPDLPGVHGERSVVGGAACYHVRRGAQELPRQVRDAAVMTAAESLLQIRLFDIPLAHLLVLSFSLFHSFSVAFTLNYMTFLFALAQLWCVTRATHQSFQQHLGFSLRLTQRSLDGTFKPY